MAPEFYIRTGELSAYGFACGYQELKKFYNISLTMWKEHNTYHVRAHDGEKREIIFWKTYEDLGPAREQFRNSLMALQREVE